MIGACRTAGTDSVCVFSNCSISFLMFCCSVLLFFAGTSCSFLKCSNHLSCEIWGICFGSNVSGIDFNVFQNDEESVSVSSSSLHFSAWYLFRLLLINDWYCFWVLWYNSRISGFVGSLCFSFASFLKAFLFNLHSLSNHFLVKIFVFLRLRLTIFRLRDCEAALCRILSKDSTASSIPFSVTGNSQFIKSAIKVWVLDEINAWLNKLAESLSQINWVGNFLNVLKSNSFPLWKLEKYKFKLHRQLWCR